MSSLEARPHAVGHGRRPWWLAAVRPGTVERSATVRILRLVGVAVIAITLLVAASSVAMVLLRRDLITLSSRIEPQTQQNRDLQQAMDGARDQVRDYQLTGASAFADQFVRDRPELERRLAALPGAFDGDPDLVALADAERVAGEAWLSNHAAPATTGRHDARTPAEVRDGTAAYQRFAALGDRLDQQLRLRASALVHRSDALLVGGIAAILVIAVLGKVMVLRPGIRALRLIGPPLQSLYGAAQAQRAGDLGARADPHHGVVEIRAVALALNALADSREAYQRRMSTDLADSRFLAGLSRQVNHSLKVEDVINPTLRPVAEFFGTSAAWIRAWDSTADTPGTGQLVAYPIECRLTSPAFLIDCAQHIATLAWERRTSYVLGDRRPRDAEYISAESHAAMLAHIGTVGQSAVIIVPIGCGDEALGYLALARPDGAAAWSESERDTLQRVGRMLGQAIVHARVYRREQQLVAELQELDSHKQQFVSMVSHELRTPLAAIVGHLELVQGGDFGPMPHHIERSVAAMARNSERLGRLIEDLLVISRIESSDDVADTPVDLTELAVDICQLHERRAGTGQVLITLDAPRPAPVNGNADELERVISNLLGNAIKFSPPGSRIEVSVGEHAGTAVLRISDQGLGISESDQRQLFSRFFRSTNPLAQGIPGTGLGLSITRQIVLKHRGRIAVTSAVGQGSTFTVTLPAVPQQSGPRTPVGAGSADSR